MTPEDGKKLRHGVSKFYRVLTPILTGEHVGRLDHRIMQGFDRVPTGVGDQVAQVPNGRFTIVIHVNGGVQPQGPINGKPRIVRLG